MPEEWRPVVGLEGKYEVSSHGQIKSLARTYDKLGYEYRATKVLEEDLILKLQDYKGNNTVQLPNKNYKPKQYRWSVGALVLAAFVGPKPDGAVAFHIDRDGLNDVIDNLVYIPRGVLLQLNSPHEKVRDRGERLLEKYVSGELS
jgi:hypothetical protein